MELIENRGALEDSGLQGPRSGVAALVMEFAVQAQGTVSLPKFCIERCDWNWGRRDSAGF
jgi:hypothetical protein